MKGKRHGREAEKRGGNATPGGDFSRAWRGPYPKGVCFEIINELQKRCTTYRIAIRLQALGNQPYTGGGVQGVSAHSLAGGCKGGGAPPAGGSGGTPPESFFPSQGGKEISAIRDPSMDVVAGCGRGPWKGSFSRSTRIPRTGTTRRVSWYLPRSSCILFLRLFPRGMSCSCA